MHAVRYGSTKPPPVINRVQHERRQAEQQVVQLRARLRLLKDTCHLNEVKARRDMAIREHRYIAQGDHDSHKEDVRMEMLRRQLTVNENVASAAEQRLLNREHREYSRRIAAESRAAAAQAVRSSMVEKSEAVREMHRDMWQARTERARHAREESRWFKNATQEHAAAFTNRLRELREMGVAEEETRLAMVYEMDAELRAALESEEAHLHDLQQHVEKAGQDLGALSKVDKRAAAHFAGWGGSGGGVGLKKSSSSPLATYQIAGPSGATVKRGGALVTRVHFIVAKDRLRRDPPHASAAPPWPPGIGSDGGAGGRRGNGRRAMALPLQQQPLPALVAAKVVPGGAAAGGHMRPPGEGLVVRPSPYHKLAEQGELTQYTDPLVVRRHKR